MTDPQSPDTPEANDDDFQDDLNILDEGADKGRRPPLIALIGGALALLIIGAGLATVFAPSTSAPAAPTSAAALDTTAAPAAAAGDLPTPAVPTALPLPQAIGDTSSTEPVAQVGDATITRGEFVRAYQPGAPPSDVLQQLIQVELVVQAAQAEGVSVDQSKVDDQIAQIKQQNAISDTATFNTFLQDNNIGSEQELRALIGRDQVVEQMLLTHTTMEQAHARHILLATSTDNPTDDRQAEAEALLKQIQDGADFATLASEKSEDTGTKDNGGDLGWAPRGLFVPEFDDAIFSMKKGEVRLVKSQFGWHIIEVIDPAEMRGLESRDMLSTTPGQQAFTDTFLPWVGELESAAKDAQKIKILVTDDQLVTSPGA
ncbi:peptidylprolyl isomerase [Oscillochloris sp. ZM17-4]|uniref:foldase protein PrsA n=1 Tax=Oscillochloris sp. ZM17-4 TaxID=2866714 RepID=UPI001C73AC44|nr:peptidylprolyl isomerase [Oscillochloris sp. ZM17-4]